MLTYLVGPFLALLPRRWRSLLSVVSAVNWRWATVLSGFGESVAALAALMFWYSYYMNLLVSRGIDSAITGEMGGATGEEIGFTALVIWATHPLTWLIAYAGVEGSVRLVGAAFTETYLGSFPLFAMDKIFLKLSGRSEPSVAEAAGYKQGNWSSYSGAIREKVRLSRIPLVPDELCFSESETDQILEIRACRRKADWTPPKTVLYQGAFYRLEESSEGPDPRPFQYRLRRLSAGVMGWGVLVYSPDDTPVIAKK